MRGNLLSLFFDYCEVCHKMRCLAYVAYIMQYRGALWQAYLECCYECAEELFNEGGE